MDSKDKTVGALLVVALTGMGLACGSGKKSGTKDDSSGEDHSNEDPTTIGKAGIKENSGNTLGISGQLAIALNLSGPDAQLTAAPSKGVVLFGLDYKSQVQIQKVLDVGPDGRFDASIERNQKSAFDGVITGDHVNRDLLKKIFPEYADMIDQMPDSELIGGIREELDNFKEHPDLNYVLVSFDKSGDPEAEAASMQFIGLPTPGASLKLLPGGALKGDISMGRIEGQGDEATSELKAGDSINLPPSAIAELASASKTLKILKNVWLNPKKAAEVTPWFNYTVADVASAANHFTAPDGARFSGGGYYIKVNDIDATFGQVCPDNPGAPGDTSGSPYNATPSKILNWYPPRDIASTAAPGGTYGPSNPYTNEAPQYRRQSQYGETQCSAEGSHTQVYVRARSNDSKDYQLGLGENIKGASPEGLWRLKVGDQEKGRWDLAAAAPYDTDGDPVIYIPGLKVVTDANGMATGLEIKFYFFEKSTHAYREVTDAVALKNFTHSFNCDGTYAQAHSRGDLSIESNTFKFDGNILKAPIPPAAQAQFPCPNPVGSNQCITGLGFNYHVGAVSYRLSLSTSGF